MDEVKLTRLASCAGCGAKLGAGELARLLQGLPVQHDERLIVGYDTSDDASVYVLNEDLALVQTVDFFPPIVDDPYLFGQIAAANALSDVYAMGGEPKLAMNVMCVNPHMDKEAVQAILRGGYAKAYEAGVIITGGHTIEDKEPKYGLAVTGFVRPQQLLRNSTACEGDVLILTKPLGAGILMTAAQGDFVDPAVLKQLYGQMARLNKTARDIMTGFAVHGCTDVTGFGLLGHAFEMARGSGLTLHIHSQAVPHYSEACDMAAMGLVPAGAYRNRAYTEGYVRAADTVSQAMMDVLYDPQTSGGLLMAVGESDAAALLKALQDHIPCAEIIGFAAAKEDAAIVVG